MIYSDLLRFVGLLASRWLTFFQALTEQAFCSGTKQGNGPCWHLNTTMNHQYRDSSTGHKRCVDIELVFTFFSGCLVCCFSTSFLLVVGALYFSLKISASSSSSANRSIVFLGLTFSCSAITRGNQSSVLRGKDSTRT